MPHVYAVLFDVGVVPACSPKDSFHEALRLWIGNRWPAAEPWFDLKQAGSVRSKDGSIFRWEPYEEGDRYLLDFSWRHPHVDDPTIHWSTQAALFHDAGRTRLALEVQNTGPEISQSSGLRTTRPRLLLEMLDAFRLRMNDVACARVAGLLSADTISDFVRYTLFDTKRRWPVIMLSPRSDGSYVVDPEDFAREWVGLGEPVVLDSPATTFRLTDELGSKELSCFHGGLRVYLPGLGATPDPYRHPLLVARRAAVPGERLRLSQHLAHLTTFRYQEDPALGRLADERAVKMALERAEVMRQLQDAQLLAVSGAGWEPIALELDKTNHSLQARVAYLEEQLDTANSKVKALQYALAQQSSGQVPAAAEPLFLPSTVREVVELAQATFGDYLLILPQALDAAEDSPFSDPAALYQALRGLAELSKRMSAGPLGRSIRDVCTELGLDYASGIASTTSKKLQQQYRFRFDGVEYTCEEHIRLGGGTYDPQYCARIYFTSSQSCKSKLVIGHIGRHLDVMSTT